MYKNRLLLPIIWFYLILLVGNVHAENASFDDLDITQEPTPGRFFQVRNESGHRSVVGVASKADINWRWLEQSEWNMDRYFDPNISDNLRPNGGLSMKPKFAPNGSQVKPRNSRNRTGYDWPLLWIPAWKGHEPDLPDEKETTSPVICLPPLASEGQVQPPVGVGAHTTGTSVTCPTSRADDFKKCSLTDIMDQLPDISKWLDNTALERVRNQKSGKGFTLAKRTGNDATEKEKKILAEAHQQLNKTLALWSCLKVKHNLLHKKKDTRAFKAKRKFTKDSRAAVSDFQVYAGLKRFGNKRGILDRKTLINLDRFVGVSKAGITTTPDLRGNQDDKSTFEGKSHLAKGLNKRQSRPGKVAHIYFPTKGKKLSKDDLNVLDQVANHYAFYQPRYLQFALFGFTDKRDSVGQNQKLGKQRVRAVKNVLSSMFVKYAAKSKGLWQIEVIADGEYFGEVERPQIGSIKNGDEEFRRYRRVDIVLVSSQMDPCWECTEEELNGDRPGDIGRAGCMSTCIIDNRPNPYKCDVLTGKNWSVTAEISGGCYTFACLESGELMLDNGVCTAKYSYVAGGAGGGFTSVGVSWSKIGPIPFKTDKSISFDGFHGKLMHYTMGMAMDAGIGVDSFQFIDAGTKNDMEIPFARGGGLSEDSFMIPGAAVSVGGIRRMGRPTRKVPKE